VGDKSTTTTMTSMTMTTMTMVMVMTMVVVVVGGCGRFGGGAGDRVRRSDWLRGRRVDESTTS
jgi:hypothetical protein